MQSIIKKVRGELSWSMDIQEMPSEGDFSSPLFCWTFDGEDGVVLCAWPFHGFFIFKVRGKEAKFTSIEELLKEIDSYGWGEPPHLQEVFKDVIETKEKSPADSLKEFTEVAEKLRQKWNSLIA